MSVGSDKPTAAERIAAVAARREASKKTWAEAFEVQRAPDMERLADLEDEHGFERVERFDVPGWNPGEGAATLVVVRIPRAKENLVKRFEQKAVRSKEGDGKTLEAGHELAKACVLYPSEKTEAELYEATMDLAAAMLSHIGAEIMKKVNGRKEDEKKG